MTNGTFYLLGLLAVSCYASLGAITKKLGVELPKFTFIGITMLMMSVLSLGISLYAEKDFSIKAVTPNVWLGLVLFVLINFVGFALYVYVINHVPVTDYQMIALMSPVVGGIVAYFLLGETVDVRKLMGFAVMAIGLTIALYRR